MRILHLSDVHVTVPIAALPWRQMFNKRLIGALNLTLRRARHFEGAADKLHALAAFAEREHVDLVICTGDYTALGTEPELIAARRAIAPLTSRPYGFVTVPGNHDLYLPDCIRDRRFERNFEELLHSDLPETRVEGPWPIVRLVGDDIAVVAVNSARANPQPWRSSGSIPDAQLRALQSLCEDPRIAQRFVFVITHYAPFRSDGTPDRRSHGLVNAPALLDACRSLRRGALLHGHIHHRFCVNVPGFSLPIFSAGSTTCDGREGFWLFELDQASARAVPGSWTGGRYEVHGGAALSLGA